MSKEMIVCTVSSNRPLQPYYCYDGYLAMMRRHGVEPVILGDPKFRGLATKPRYVVKYLMEQKVSDSTPVIFSDCWDVLFEDSPQVVWEKFHGFKCEVVINAENNCFPLVELREQFDALDSSTPYRYLNSGFFVGYKGAIISMLQASGALNPPEDYQEAGKWHHFEDQSPLQKLFLAEGEARSMKLDRNGELCCTLGGAELTHFDFNGEKIRNTLTGSTPSVWHANGGGKTTPVFQAIRQRLRV